MHKVELQPLDAKTIATFALCSLWRRTGQARSGKLAIGHRPRDIVLFPHVRLSSPFAFRGFESETHSPERSLKRQESPGHPTTRLFAELSNSRTSSSLVCRKSRYH